MIVFVGFFFVVFAFGVTLERTDSAAFRFRRFGVFCSFGVLLAEQRFRRVAGKSSSIVSPCSEGSVSGSAAGTASPASPSALICAAEMSIPYVAGPISKVGLNVRTAG